METKDREHLMLEQKSNKWTSGDEIVRSSHKDRQKERGTIQRSGALHLFVRPLEEVLEHRKLGKGCQQ